MTRLGKIIRSTAALGALGAALPADASGTRIMVQTWNPMAAQPDGLQLLASRPESLESMIATGWDAMRGRICDDAKKKIAERVLAKSNGKTVAPLDQMTCEVGPARDVVLTTNRQLQETKLRVLANKIRIKLVNDGFPDFFVEVPFTIFATIKSRTGDPGRLLTLVSANASVMTLRELVKIEGASLAANAVKLFVVDIANVDVPMMITQQVNRTAVPLGDVVKNFNDQLSQAAPTAVAQAIEIRMWRRSGTTIFSLKPRLPELPRSTVTGTVIARVGMPDCDRMTFVARADGPGMLRDPFASPPRFEKDDTVTSTAALARVQGAASLPPTPFAQGVTSERRCTYAIADAPIGGLPRVEGTSTARSQDNRPAGVSPGERAVRAPATNVNFETAWGQAFRMPITQVERGSMEIQPVGPIERPEVRPQTNPRGQLGRGAPVVRPQTR